MMHPRQAHANRAQGNERVNLVSGAAHPRLQQPRPAPRACRRGQAQRGRIACLRDGCFAPTFRTTRSPRYRQPGSAAHPLLWTRLAERVDAWRRQARPWRRRLAPANASLKRVANAHTGVAFPAPMRMAGRFLLCRGESLL